MSIRTKLSFIVILLFLLIPFEFQIFHNSCSIHWNSLLHWNGPFYWSFFNFLSMISSRFHFVWFGCLSDFPDLLLYSNRAFLQNGKNKKIINLYQSKSSNSFTSEPKSKSLANIAHKQESKPFIKSINNWNQNWGFLDIFHFINILSLDLPY